MLMSVLLQVLPHLTIWISIQVLIPVPHQVLIQFYHVFWFLCRTNLQSLYFLSYICSSNLRYKYCSFFPIKMLLPNISSVAYRQNIGLRTFPRVFFLLQVYFQVLWSSSKSYTTQWCTLFHFKSHQIPNQVRNQVPIQVQLSNQVPNQAQDLFTSQVPRKVQVAHQLLINVLNQGQGPDTNPKSEPTPAPSLDPDFLPTPFHNQVQVQVQVQVPGISPKHPIQPQHHTNVVERVSDGMGRVSSTSTIDFTKDVIHLTHPQIFLNKLHLAQSWVVLQVVNPVLFQVLFLVLPQDSIQVIYQVLCQVLFQVLTQANLLVSTLISSNIGLSICSFSSIQCFSPFLMQLLLMPMLLQVLFKKEPSRTGRVLSF